MPESETMFFYQTERTRDEGLHADLDLQKHWSSALNPVGS